MSEQLLNMAAIADNETAYTRAMEMGSGENTVGIELKMTTGTIVQCRIDQGNDGANWISESAVIVSVVSSTPTLANYGTTYAPEEAPHTRIPITGRFVRMRVTTSGGAAVVSLSAEASRQ